MCCVRESHEQSQKSIPARVGPVNLRIPRRRENKMKRFLSCLCGLMLAAPMSAAAQEYPSKNIRLVASFSTGAFQILSHVVSENLSPVLGQPVVIDYRPGGGGNIGVEYAAKAPADGYTLAIINSSHAIAPILNKRLKYELLRDFAPITLLATVPNLLVVHPSLPARTL